MGGPGVELDRVPSVDEGRRVARGADCAVVDAGAAGGAPVERFEETTPDLPVGAVVDGAGGVAEALSAGAARAVPRAALAADPDAVAARVVERGRRDRRAVREAVETVDAPVTVHDPETGRTVPDPNRSALGGGSRPEPI